MTAKTKLNIIVALAIIFWASAFVAIRIGLKGYSPGSLALLRFLIASVCMLLIYLRKRPPQKLAFPQITQMILLGVVGFSIYHFFLNYSEMTVQAGIASFVVSQSPVIITLLSIMFLSERLTASGWLGTAISFIGIVIISLGSNINAHIDMGIIYVLIATLAGCLYTTLQKPLLNKIHPLTFSCYSMWGGTLFLLFFLPDLIHELPRVPISANIAVIYLGIFPGAIAYLLWSYALRLLSASKLGSALYALPLCAMLLGWLLLGEIPSLIATVGGLLALFGAYLVNKGSYSK